jgi:hypothetical protein
MQAERDILIPRCKGQQGDVPRLLNGARESPLVCGADTGQAAGNNLAALRNELLQQAHIAIVDRIDLLHAKLADLLAPEELPSAGAAGPTWTTSAGAAATRPTRGAVSCGTIRTIAGGTLRAIWTFG